MPSGGRSGTSPPDGNTVPPDATTSQRHARTSHGDRANPPRLSTGAVQVGHVLRTSVRLGRVARDTSGSLSLATMAVRSRVSQQARRTSAPRSGPPGEEQLSRNVLWVIGTTAAVLARRLATKGRGPRPMEAMTWRWFRMMPDEAPANRIRNRSRVAHHTGGREGIHRGRTGEIRYTVNGLRSQAVTASGSPSRARPPPV